MKSDAILPGCGLPIRRRSRHSGFMPTAVNTPGVGLENFFSAPYQAHNRARLDHLASLGLPLSKCTVLELGSGPGDHTEFYVRRECRIVAVDSRQACLDVLKERYPDVQTVLCDLNAPDALSGLGVFDVIHCYGILYHLEDPGPLIRFMGRACKGLAIVESCVSAEWSANVEAVGEPAEDYTQSSTGQACRPTRQWIFQQLGDCFPFVYHTRTQPNHPEFPIDWNDLGNAPPLIRAVFVGSKERLDRPSLSPTLLDQQQRLDPQVYIDELETTLAEHRGVLSERDQLIHQLHAEAADVRGQLERAVATIETWHSNGAGRHEDGASASQSQLQMARARTDLSEGAVGERLAELQLKGSARAKVRSQLEQASGRAQSLEAAASERLAELRVKDAALADLRSQLEQAHGRAQLLEEAANERLGELRVKEATLADLRSQLEQAHGRAQSLEAAANERLAELELKHAALADLRSQIEQAHARADLLEVAANERLCELEIKEAALADLRSQIQQAHRRADWLEAAGAERLAELEVKDSALADLRSQLEQAHTRADSLEAAANERLAELEVKDSALADLRSQIQQAHTRVDSLEVAASQRLAELQVVTMALNELREDFGRTKAELSKRIRDFESESLREYLRRLHHRRRARGTRER